MRKNTVLLISIIGLAIAIGLFKKYMAKQQDVAQKVLVTANTAKVKGLDPAHADDSYSIRETSKVYEGLLDYHYLKRPYELVPNLAEELPVMSDDGLTYTFTIRRGVKFHNNPCFPQGKGRELVATDFGYAIQRIADPKVQSPWFSIFAGKLQGLDAWRDQCFATSTSDYSTPVAGIQVLDKYTLQFKLTRPWPQLPYVLAMVCCSAVPKEAVDYYGAEFLNHPVGTGPFIIEAFNPQLNKLVYHKNPTFRQKFFPTEASAAYQHMLADAGKQLPLVDKIVTHILTEEQPRWLKFQKGQLDVINISGTNIALKVIEDRKLTPELAEKGITLTLEPAPHTTFLAINCSHELFKNNLKLRQALSLAFDGKRYNELFYNDIGTPAQSLIPPGLAGHDPNYTNPYKGCNLTQAQALLAAAGYPNGKGLPVITLDMDASTPGKQTGEFFQKCVAPLGIKVKVIPNIWPELEKKIRKKSTMMHFMGWGATYPDAENFLELLYKSDQRIGLGPSFNDAAFNALYEKATMMQPSAARDAIYQQLNKIAAESVPAIYMIHAMGSTLHHSWVKNYVWASIHEGTEQYINIDLAEQKAMKQDL